MKIHPLLLPALFLAFSVLRTGVAQSLQTDIPLKIASGKPVVDGVFLDGHGPYRFLLDTGSQSNHLDTNLARKLGFVATLRLDLQTTSGGTTVRGGRIGKVSLQPAGADAIEAGNQEFLFTRFDNLSTLPPDIRGILGQEFLSHFDYTLDLQHHRLAFGTPSAPGVQTGFRLIFGRMAVATSLGDLILDSGADMLFIFRQSTRAANAQVVGVSGAGVSVAYETAPELRIGERRYRPSKAAYHPVPAAEEAGLLPANLFHAIFICNSKHYVVFDPLP